MPAAAAESWTDLVFAVRHPLSAPTCEKPRVSVSSPAPAAASPPPPPPPQAASTRAAAATAASFRSAGNVVVVRTAPPQASLERRDQCDRCDARPARRIL